MSEETTYTALGLMSGTSLDGVDVAIIQTDGENLIAFGQSTALSYDEGINLVRDATQACLKWKFKGPPPNIIQAASEYIDRSHIQAIEHLRVDLNQIDLIGYHGQTVLHHPPKDGQGGQTLQIGNGQVLADQFGVPCVFDFRTKDVKAGGQGAPLAPIYHKALVNYSNLGGLTAVLNLGGVGNVTLVGPELLMATDTGPANGPLDSWMEMKGHKRDEGGNTSRKGQVDFDRIGEWLNRDFFTRDLPRSADRYDFDVVSEIKDMSLEDGAATLCAFTVLSVKQSLAGMEAKPDRLIVCGGGRHNHTLMNMLRLELGYPVITAETVGWDADMIEAQAFAYLAVRSHLGLPISFPRTTGVSRPMTGGKTAYPLIRD